MSYTEVQRKWNNVTVAFSDTVVVTLCVCVCVCIIVGEVVLRFSGHKAEVETRTA